MAICYSSFALSASPRRDDLPDLSQQHHRSKHRLVAFASGLSRSASAACLVDIFVVTGGFVSCERSPLATVEPAWKESEKPDHQGRGASLQREARAARVERQEEEDSSVSDSGLESESEGSRLADRGGHRSRQQQTAVTAASLSFCLWAFES